MDNKNLISASVLLVALLACENTTNVITPATEPSLDELVENPSDLEGRLLQLGLNNRDIAETTYVNRAESDAKAGSSNSTRHYAIEREAMRLIIDSANERWAAAGIDNYITVHRYFGFVGFISTLTEVTDARASQCIEESFSLNNSDANSSYKKQSCLNRALTMSERYALCLSELEAAYRGRSNSVASFELNTPDVMTISISRSGWLITCNRSLSGVLDDNSSGPSIESLYW